LRFNLSGDWHRHQARSQTASPVEIGWFIGGQDFEGFPIDCDEDLDINNLASECAGI
jgi:hypothetical protein